MPFIFSSSNELRKISLLFHPCCRLHNVCRECSHPNDESYNMHIVKNVHRLLLLCTAHCSIHETPLAPLRVCVCAFLINKMKCQTRKVAFKFKLCDGLPCFLLGSKSITAHISPIRMGRQRREKTQENGLLGATRRQNRSYRIVPFAW